MDKREIVERYSKLDKKPIEYWTIEDKEEFFTLRLAAKVNCMVTYPTDSDKKLVKLLDSKYRQIQQYEFGDSDKTKR